MFLILLKLTLCVRAKYCHVLRIGDIFLTIYILHLSPDKEEYSWLLGSLLFLILSYFIVPCGTVFNKHRHLHGRLETYHRKGSSLGSGWTLFTIGKLVT